METLSKLILEHGTQISAVIMALLALSRPVRRAIYTCWKKTFGARKVQLDRIESQLLSNGGTSIKDSLLRIEEKQARFEAFMRAQLNTQNIPIMRTNKEGKVIFVNRAWQRMTGFSTSEASGDGWINIIAYNDRERVRDIWEDAVKEGREFDELMWFLGKDTKAYQVHIHMFKEEVEGDLHGWTGYALKVDHETRCPHFVQCLEASKCIGVARD